MRTGPSIKTWFNLLELARIRESGTDMGMGYHKKWLQFDKFYFLWTIWGGGQNKYLKYLYLKPESNIFDK